MNDRAGKRSVVGAGAAVCDHGSCVPQTVVDFVKSEGCVCLFVVTVIFTESGLQAERNGLCDFTRISVQFPTP